MLCTPLVMGHRPSSPLNPYASSSSPATSPTPAGPSYRPTPFAPFGITSPVLRHRHSLPASTSTRYARPSPGGRQNSSPTSTGLFGAAATPTDRARLAQSFSRRMEERARRSQARQDELARRRSLPQRSGAEDVFDEEAERRAQADDEELFRRFEVHRIRKIQRAQLAEEERELGSDPMSPDFWDEPFDAPAGSSRRKRPDPDDSMGDPRTPLYNRHAEYPSIDPTIPEETEEERWAREAAEAEDAEWEAAELEAIRQFEEEQWLSEHRPSPQALEHSVTSQHFEHDQDEAMDTS